MLGLLIAEVGNGMVGDGVVGDGMVGNGVVCDCVVGYGVVGNGSVVYSVMSDGCRVNSMMCQGSRVVVAEGSESSELGICIWGGEGRGQERCQAEGLQGLGKYSLN